ncbi:MAG: mechanosensitive ion channel family protein [Opitutus sp.]|nr:mechanosensitive ion channel family protein [Opitutus sp.]
MKRFFLLFGWALALAFGPVFAWAAEATPADSPSSTVSSADVQAQHANTTAAAVVTGATHSGARAPDFLEHLVDSILELFNVRSSGNTPTHYAISAILLAAAFLLRRIVTGIIFGQLQKLAAKTETTLDDKLFPAMEGPVATFVMVTGIFASLKVLKLSENTDRYIGYGSTVAFSLVIFWGLLRAFNAVLAHAEEIARERQMGVAAFMPWIKKTLVTVFVVLGVLITAQSLGFEVRAFLAGLGIGGLAFALAAQDTIANLFGSIVVAIDQPFKIGETVKIGVNTGTVEDIGLRSTKIRLVDRSLVIIPNKTVSSEAIVNLSRFTQRRTEQVIALTYDTKPDQLEALVEEFRQIILCEEAVEPTSVLVFFRDLNPSSLDIWLVYLCKSPDFQGYMKVRQRINLALMRAVTSRGLAFAFPTQTVQLDGPVARKLVEPKN